MTPLDCFYCFGFVVLLKNLYDYIPSQEIDMDINMINVHDSLNKVSELRKRWDHVLSVINNIWCIAGLLTPMRWYFAGIYVGHIIIALLINQLRIKYSLKKHLYTVNAIIWDFLLCYLLFITIIIKYVL